MNPLNAESEIAELQCDERAAPIASDAVDIPPIIKRLVAEHVSRTGLSARDYSDLFQEIAREVGATDTFDWLSVMDITDATFEILRLHQFKQYVIERMREKRREELALRECSILARQRTLARFQRIGYTKFMEGIDDPDMQKQYEKQFRWFEGEPLPPQNAPPYEGAYSQADIAKFNKPLNSAADDGQAFLDSMDPLDRINDMLEVAEKRRERAFDDITIRRRKLGERRRETSRVIDGTVNHDGREDRSKR